LSYRRSRQAAYAGVIAIVEHDDDLAGPWAAAVDGVNSVAVVETPDGYGPGIDQVEVFIPRASKTRGFARLTVTVP